ncbi:hypothetical protein Tco_0936584 [Tanacetum coccineum]
MTSGGIDRDAEDALYKLLQMGTVAKYLNEFKMLINRVTGISESLLKTFYISGLKPALQCALLRSNPTTLSEAFSLALATEARFTDLQLWELLRSNPITLGETFFKAHITEAHFKEERFTTTIAKANDLNTGVQVQDLELETKVLVDGKQDDVKVVKVVGVTGHQNSNEPNVLKGNGVIGVRVNKNNKGDDKEVQYSVYALHVLIQLLMRLNDKYIKKKKMEAIIQRILWDLKIKSVFQDNTLRARIMGERRKGEEPKASNIEVVKDGTVPSISADSGNAGKEVVSPSAVDETVTKERQCPLMETIGLESYIPLPTQGTTTAGTTPGKSSYANVTGTPSGTKVNFCTLFTPGGNRIDVVIPVESIQPINVNLLKEDVGTVPVWVKLYGISVTAFSEDGLSDIATKIVTPLMLDSYTSNMCMQSWDRCSYARAIIELRADVELKDNIMAVMPKITREGYYTCVAATKNLKKTSQIPKEILVGQKMGFKPTKQQVYQPVFKKPTANHGGNKKKNVDPANEMEKLIIDGKASLVDNEGKPLRKVNDDSEDEVASDDNEMASFLAKKDG